MWYGENMSIKRIRLQATGLLIGYGFQFIAGMTLNLFVTLPKKHPGDTGKEYFARSGHSLVWSMSGGGGLALTIHTYIALALFLGSVTLLVRCIRARNKLWIWCSSLATFFTLAALFNGLSFVNYNENFSSMIMATGWLIAVSALIFGLIKSAKTAEA